MKRSKLIILISAVVIVILIAIGFYVSMNRMETTEDSQVAEVVGEKG